eukprot:3313853-Rhodomonas_salina.1
MCIRDRVLRGCYDATSATAIAQVPSLRACYAVPGTDYAYLLRQRRYAATAPVLTRGSSGPALGVLLLLPPGANAWVF